MVSRRTIEAVVFTLLNTLIVVLVVSWDGLPGFDRWLSRLGAYAIGFLIARVVARSLAGFVYRGRDRTV